MLFGINKSHVLLVWHAQEQTYKGEKENQVHNTGQYGRTGENGTTAEIQYVKPKVGDLDWNTKIVFIIALVFSRHQTQEHGAQLQPDDVRVWDW